MSDKELEQMGDIMARVGDAVDVLRAANSR